MFSFYRSSCKSNRNYITSEISFGSLSLFLFPIYPSTLSQIFPVFGFAIFLYFVIFSLSSIADCSDSDPFVYNPKRSYPVLQDISRGRNNSSANRRQRRPQCETLSLASRICTYEAYTRPIIQGTEHSTFPFYLDPEAACTCQNGFCFLLPTLRTTKIALRSLISSCLLSYFASLCRILHPYVFKFKHFTDRQSRSHKQSKYYYKQEYNNKEINYYKNSVQNIFQKMLYYFCIVTFVL